MFLKRLQRRKSGKRHTYWAWVESLRTAKGPRHWGVAYLGELAPHEEKGWALSAVAAQAGRLAGKLDTKVLPVVEPTLFDTEDVSDRVPDEARVHIKGVRVEGTQDFGDVGLGVLLWRTLDLDKLFRTLLPQGREEVPWHVLACILAVARFCEPLSELHIEDTWYPRTSLPEMLGVRPETVYVQRLYRALDGWIRRKLRCLRWRQWKRTYTRARNMMKRGLGEKRAWQSATNGRGPWWNSGASHMNEAFLKKFFDQLGLVSLLHHHKRLAYTS